MAIDERFYEEAGVEVARGVYRNGLRIRAFSEAEGDEQKVTYIHFV